MRIGKERVRNISRTIERKTRVLRAKRRKPRRGKEKRKRGESDFCKLVNLLNSGKDEANFQLIICI